MTQIWPMTVACPECGAEAQTFFLASHSTFGFDDFKHVDHVTCPNGHRIEGDFIEFTRVENTDADALADQAERELAADDRFSPEEETLDEGETEIILGEWIPGARRPKAEE